MIRTIEVCRNPAALALTLGLGVAGCATPPGEVFPVQPKPIVWPAPPSTARIRFLGAISNGADLKPGRSASEAFLTVVRGPSQTYPLGSPHAVAVSGDLICVTSPSTATVHVLDLQSREHRRIWQAGDRALCSPIGIAATPDELFVSDSVLHCIAVYGRDGSFQRRFGENDLKRPTGMVFVPEGDRLYVLDSEADSCVVFNRAGQMLSRFGSSGTGPGQFNRPSHLTFAPPDKLWIADTMNCRVQQFDLDGRWISAFGQRGDGGGDLSLPKGIGVDRDGSIYVVDAHFENVQIFDSAGRLLLAFGGPGAGVAGLSVPAGLAIDSRNRIWVADSYNHRLAVYECLPESVGVARGG